VGLEPALPRFGVIQTAAQYDAQRKLPKKSLKQGINIKTMCPNYILEFRNTH